MSPTHTTPQEQPDGHTKEIDGLDFPYEVSRDGRVFSLSGWRGVQRRELAQTPNSHGYVRVFVMRDGRKCGLKVHSLVASAFLPPRPTPSHEVRHLNGNRADPSAANLAWGTAAENAADREAHGRTSRGQSHSEAIKRGLEARHV